MSIENQDELMMQAAVMYYRDDMTQAEIAKKLYLSRTKISRMLKEARETKKVEIYINGENQRNTFLETIFQSSFGLEKAMILANLSTDKEKAFHELAMATAEYI